MRHSLRLLFCFSSLSFLSLAFACGGKVTPNTGAASAPGGDGAGVPEAPPTPGQTPPGALGTPPAPGQPPSKPPPSPPPSTAIRTFAVSRFFAGDTTRAGTPSTIAWKTFGYDLDGRTTTRTSADVCTPAAGAGRDSQIDGEFGIDNAWGARIVPILQTFQHDVSPSLTSSIRSGAFGYLFEVTGLADAPGQTNTNVAGQLYDAAAFSGVPSFTRADHWPVLASSLAGGTLGGGAKTKFPTAYMSGGVWVNGARSDVTVSFFFGDTKWSFTVHHAIVTFEHPSPSQIGLGTIAGVVGTTELIASLRAIAGAVSDSLCSASAFDSIAQQIAMASDMRADGTNGPGAACDAISIGLGFDADEIADVSSMQPDPPPPPNPCP